MVAGSLMGYGGGCPRYDLRYDLSDLFVRMERSLFCDVSDLTWVMGGGRVRTCAWETGGGTLRRKWGEASGCCQVWGAGFGGALGEPGTVSRAR